MNSNHSLRVTEMVKPVPGLLITDMCHLVFMGKYYESWHVDIL